MVPAYQYSLNQDINLILFSTISAFKKNSPINSASSTISETFKLKKMSDTLIRGRIRPSNLGTSVRKHPDHRLG